MFSSCLPAVFHLLLIHCLSVLHSNVSGSSVLVLGQTYSSLFPSPAYMLIWLLPQLHVSWLASVHGRRWCKAGRNRKWAAGHSCYLHLALADGSPVVGSHPWAPRAPAGPGDPGPPWALIIRLLPLPLRPGVVPASTVLPPQLRLVPGLVPRDIKAALLSSPVFKFSLFQRQKFFHFPVGPHGCIFFLDV